MSHTTHMLIIRVGCSSTPRLWLMPANRSVIVAGIGLDRRVLPVPSTSSARSLCAAGVALASVGPCLVVDEVLGSIVVDGLLPPVEDCLGWVAAVAVVGVVSVEEVSALVVTAAVVEGDPAGCRLSALVPGGAVVGGAAAEAGPGEVVLGAAAGANRPASGLVRPVSGLAGCVTGGGVVVGGAGLVVAGTSGAAVVGEATTVSGGADVAVVFDELTGTDTSVLGLGMVGFGTEAPPRSSGLVVVELEVDDGDVALVVGAMVVEGPGAAVEEVGPTVEDTPTLDAVVGAAVVVLDTAAARLPSATGAPSAVAR